MKLLIFPASLAVALAWITAAWSAPATKPQVSHAKAIMSHQVWVEQSLREMNTIKVGMTRQQLMKVFTYPGGLWALRRTQQTFAYKDCPSFLVDVEFKPAGFLKKGMRESPSDRITKISKPYINQVYYR